ncbi:MAG TPA: amino acid adenylation domain-containing protein, partial [Clostridia bacterium]|nr:amino acid adenylation domain-containing protein [Clostridia bacterium]
MRNKIARKNVEDIFALTPLQQGMLFHYLKDTGSNEYIEQLSLRLKGTIDAGAVKRAWDHVVQCNEMLRTVYKWEKLEAPVQIVQREYEVPVRYIEITEKDEAEKLIKEIREKDKEEGIDIGTEPFRITVAKLSEDEGEMIITNHHMLYDGWSSGIIVKEFIEAYESILEGKAPIKRVKPRFKEYVKWQQGQNKEEQLEYWKSYLKGYEEKAVITGNRAEKEKEEKTAVYHEELEPELKGAMERVCREEKAAMATVINTAWGILLQRYNNTGDVVFGTTVSGRAAKLEGIEEAVGLYINTLPIRVKAEDKESIGELLRQVERETREREAYESLDLAEIQGAVEAGVGESLFDTLVVIENYPIDKHLINREGKVEVEIGEIREETNYDITMGVMLKDKIVLSISYKEGKYEADGIKRLTGHLKNILWDVSENSKKRVKEIEMTSKKEKQQLLYEFNDTYAEYPRDKTIHELFEEQAARTPDNIAVVYENSQLTYRELNEKANQLARVLKEKGVVSDSIVGIMVEPSLEMITGIMGILKAGGAYLPIDPEYPADRIRYMLEDSGSKLLLVQQHLRDKTVFDGEVIELDDEQSYAGDRNNLETFNGTDNLAYVIYTSGSTGRPKGVMIEHKSLKNLCNWHINQFNIVQEDKATKYAGFGFDASVWETFPYLIKGASLFIISKDIMLNIESLNKYIEKNGITVSFLPTQVCEQFMKLENRALRLLLTGGDKLKQYKHNSYDVVNNYGPTENTVVTTSYYITEQKDNIPIGKPISNTSIYIIDRNNDLQPIGISGELCASGDGLARGYLNKPELTEEKFVPNPFEPGTRMYRTGDLARWLPDGNIEFLGRIDHQVKIRGFRIELGEIESRLLKHEAVKDAIVISREDKNGDKYLCAYITAGRGLTVSELREYLGKELPEYMIPSYFVQLESMPLTPNGKIDRKALPEPNSSTTAGVEYEASRNEIEEKLVKIWQEVLKVEQVGINDNFFELGGHSLKATSLVAKIHKELNVEMPLREIFKAPTIKRIAEYISGQEEKVYAAIELIGERPHYELSSAQKRLYTLQQFDQESTGYNIPGVMEIEGKLDAERLKGAFRKLIERHESFRTSFELIGEEIVQKIHKELEFEIEYTDKALSAEEVKGIARSFIRPFDLGKAPLLRVGLIKLYSEKYILMFDMHHIISDGTSMGVLTDEFVKLYEGRELSPLRLQYKDYAAWQNSMLSSKAMKKQEEHWLEVFAGEIPILSLPTDYPRPAIQSFEGDNVYFELNNEITEGLRKIAKETGATMYMVLLAGFNILLSKYSGQEDIVVGSPIAGRPHADLENIIGMFVNTLAMRNYPDGNKTFREFLEEVKVKCLKAYENQGYQFEELVEKLDIGRDMSRNPLFSVMFALQNEEMEALNIEGLRVRSHENGHRISKFDITLNAMESGEKLGLNIEYCTKLFRKETIEGLAKHLTNILANITKTVEVKISEIDMLSEEEKHKLLVEFNNTYAEYPKDKTIHELFEEQVKKTPDNVAVVYEDKQLTYRELNEKANQLARVLKEKGVVPDSIVGIMVEPSLEMITGIMGILKAGGAYLPIDPEYPADRIRYMLEDSGSKLFLVQQHLRDKTVFDGEVIELGDERSYAGDSNNLEASNGSDNPAYVIYTSGSTGRPKGVMIEHKSLQNLCNWHINQFNIVQEDKATKYAGFGFDASVWETFPYLIKGASLFIISKDIMLNIESLNKYIEKNGITVSFLPTQVCEQFMKLENRALRLLLTGGDKLKQYKHNSYDVVNNYGPTENTVVTTSYYITKQNDNIPIGKPISNTNIYIVDRNNKLQPIGTAGELCISGDGLARGYLNKPELTEEKFVPNPFEPGTRMYRTGDLARWLPDGNIEFLGRIDHQVKIRGFRIELGEIESRLLSHEHIKDAIVLAKDDENGSKYLCAYIVGEKELTVSELREYLGKGLPDYMIPAYFVQLEKIPLTQNGKIDMKALPEPDGNINTGVEYEAPRNEAEEKLVKIWQEVLKVEQVGINENFFDLGGHSLKATSMMSKIHKELSVEVPLKEIFRIPTIKGLSEYIKGHAENIYAAIERIEERPYYEMSSAQKRLY